MTNAAKWQPPKHRPLPPRRVQEPLLPLPVVPADPPTRAERQLWSQWLAPSHKKEDIIDRLIEAVVTGEHCGTSLRGPRRYAAISPTGFNVVHWHEAGPEAFRRIADLDRPAHPRARDRFVVYWIRYGWTLRSYIGDDDVFFEALRKLLPPYQGPPLTLFRGQLDGQWVGPSWSSDPIVALHFALRAADFFDDPEVEGFPRHMLTRIPRALHEKRPVLLKAQMHREIIAGPISMKGQRKPYEEFIVDVRGLSNYETANVPDFSKEGSQNDSCS